MLDHDGVRCECIPSRYAVCNSREFTLSELAGVHTIPLVAFNRCARLRAAICMERRINFRPRDPPSIGSHPRSRRSISASVCEKPDFRTCLSPRSVHECKSAQRGGRWRKCFGRDQGRVDCNRDLRVRIFGVKTAAYVATHPSPHRLQLFSHPACRMAALEVSTSAKPNKVGSVCSRSLPPCVSRFALTCGFRSRKPSASFCLFVLLR